MFDIINDIENCPPHLLSSHRSFTLKVDIQETSESISKKHNVLTMFIFTDMVEICKKRNKNCPMVKSPGIINLPAGLTRLSKRYKHIELINLSHIRRVIDITSTIEDQKNLFALIIRSHQDVKEHMYIFVLLGEEVTKMQLLIHLCRHIANITCKANAESYLSQMEFHELEIKTSAEPSSTLSKAKKLAFKTGAKLSRALSMKKTPLKRTLSNMMSTTEKSEPQFASPELIVNVTDDALLEIPVVEKKIKCNTFGPSSTKYM